MMVQRRFRRHQLARADLLPILVLMLGQLASSAPDRAVDPSQLTGPTTISRPNILVIVTDDQRPMTDALAVMPNVRSLFVDGGRDFPRSVVTTPLCCPSRSSILTGRYAHNTGVLTNGDEGQVLAFDQDTTIEAYLKGAGYRTGIVGKFFNTWPLAMAPPFFDRWATLSGGYQDPVMNVDGAVHHVEGYSTSILGSQTVGILDDFDATDDDAPWFLYVAPHAPHGPYTPDEQYADATVPPWDPGPAFDERNIDDKPPWVRWRTYSRSEADQLRAAQLRTLMSVDDMVGTVFDELERLGEADTLAVFMSDNGLLWGEHHIGDSKRFPYEGSVGVPLLIRWPGHVEAGTRDGRLAANIDVVPTIKEAVDGPASDDLRPDGRSLLSPIPHRRLLLEYWRSPDSPGVPSWRGLLRRGWLYVEWRDDDGAITFREFYDLRRDPFELHNLLGDANTQNDPDVAGPSRSLARLSTCQTQSCP